MPSFSLSRLAVVQSLVRHLLCQPFHFVFALLFFLFSFPFSISHFPLSCLLQGRNSTDTRYATLKTLALREQFVRKLQQTIKTVARSWIGFQFTFADSIPWCLLKFWPGHLSSAHLLSLFFTFHIVFFYITLFYSFFIYLSLKSFPFYAFKFIVVQSVFLFLVLLIHLGRVPLIALKTLTTGINKWENLCEKCPVWKLELNLSQSKMVSKRKKETNKEKKCSILFSKNLNENLNWASVQCL